MGEPSQEATLREVLAEVSLLDIGSSFKTIFIVLGCNSLLIAVGFAFSAGAGFAGFHSNWSIPHWIYWLIGFWMFFGIYTENKSYHEHIWEIYFPKLGWVKSIPVALWFLIGAQLFILFDYDAELPNRIAMAIGWFLWLILTVLSFEMLGIGHKKLMEKRRSALLPNHSD